MLKNLLLCSYVFLSLTLQGQTIHRLESGATGAPESELRATEQQIPQGFLSAAKRTRSFAINPALQSAKSVQAGDLVDMQLFDQQRIMTEITRISTDVNGNTTLSLKTKDYPTGFGYITTDRAGKSLFFVSIPELNQKFTTEGDGLSKTNYLIEIDGDKDVLQDEEIVIPQGEAIDATCKTSAANRLAQAVPTTCLPDQNLTGTDPATIRLMMVYTPAAAAYAVSKNSSIENIIAGAMAQTAAVIANQGNGDEITLVHSEQVDYEEHANNMSLDLNNLTGTADGYMDNVHQLRKQYGADIVALITVASDYGGLGWVLDDVNGSLNYAFNVVRVQQIASTTTSIHEIGHNMGMKHNTENDSGGPPLFPYAYGWYWTGDDDIKYGSVMSYIGKEAPYFSNPDLSYHSAATGTATANNAQVFRNTKHVVAYYSDRLSRLPDAPSNIVVSNPTDNGATFTWDAVPNAVEYRFCKTQNNGGYSYFRITTNSFTVSYPNWFQPCNSYEIWIMAINECDDIANSAPITFNTFCEKEIPAGTDIKASSYHFGDIVFHANDDSGVGQIIDIPSEGLQVAGKVQLVKTFTVGKWYPVGFPFEIESISIKQGSKVITGKIYSGDTDKEVNTEFSNSGGADDNFFVAYYDGAKNVFRFTNTIEKDQAYIFYFPSDPFNNGATVEATFISSENPTLYGGNIGDFTADVSQYTLVVNPHVEKVTNFENATLYYQYNNNNHFAQVANLQAVNPFETLVIFSGTAAPNRVIGAGLGNTDIPYLRDMEYLTDQIVKTEYYNLQGQKYSISSRNGISKGTPYIVREQHRSGKVVSKVISGK
ncbi:MAG: M12 family metallo-peptidase [Candidatus Symbiothrix sp.]|jgi:hypothetical protein|nr:M12 family metallo-peptidase [Candidatus Symbiothrix sp.]